MTGGLPQGLISIEDNSTHEQDHESDEEAGLDVATIAKTWRVYSASSNVLEADTGHRLQNLFWRTWSNPHLLRNLHPVTFTNVVQHVGTGRGRIQRSRPSHAARTDRHAHDEDDSTPVPSGPPTATASPVQANSTPASSSSHTGHVRQSSNPSLRPPQSILKKPSTDHSYVEPTETFPAVLRESQMDSTGSSSTNAEALSPTSSERPRMKRQMSGGNKKASFVANTSARAKARPGIPRRKSSQGTVSQAKDRQKDLMRSPIKSPLNSPQQMPSNDEASLHLPGVNPARRDLVGPPPGLSPPLGLSAKNSAFLLPSVSSWQSVESTSPGRSGPASALMSNSMALVDPDFRKHFVEARSMSQVNLATAGSKIRKTGSVVRFAEDLPDFGKSKSKVPPSVVAPSGHRNSSSLSESAAIENSEEEEEDDEGEALVMLPRTRSQLSMAIEERRRMSGSQNLGSPDPTGQTQPNKSKGTRNEKGKDTEKEDTEDELLKMGRGDGVTKAGGPRSRLPLKPGVSAHERYRSPSPPPIF